LVLMCTPLAGSIRGRPSAPRGLTCYSWGCADLLFARRSKTLCNRPGV